MDGFYGSKDPTNSVKALKEEKSNGPGFRWADNNTTYMQYEKNTKYTQMYTTDVHNHKHT